MATSLDELIKGFADKADKKQVVISIYFTKPDYNPFLLISLYGTAFSIPFVSVAPGRASDLLGLDKEGLIEITKSFAEKFYKKELGRSYNDFLLDTYMAIKSCVENVRKEAYHAPKT